MAKYLLIFVKQCHMMYYMQADNGDVRSHSKRGTESHKDGGDGKERKHRSRDEPESKDSRHRDRDKEQRDKHRTRDKVLVVNNIL